MSRARRAAPADNFYASVTDLVIGFLFIFIILLVSFAIGFRIEQNKLQRAAELQQKARAQLLEAVVKRAGLDPKKQAALDQGIIRLPQDTLFDNNSAALRPGGEPTLRRLASALQAEVPCYTRTRIAACPKDSAPVLDAIYIEGHTNSLRAKAPWKDNWELSAARATRVRETLVQTEPGLGKLLNADDKSQVPLLGISGYAESRLVDTKNPAAAENRRVDLRFTMVPLK
ncbi:OmpA/MotB family protein [Sandarakinorhabdus rubra]|uniref:OmpA/MotB family protein n=1 Tax=Sandarakinorhabdus rubra TaxID=2672568 RepID=UPI0013DC791E|nr:OmpA family protein [Sandarakinorhabdus rubra]